MASAAVLAAVLEAPAHATGNRVLYAEVGTQADADAFAIALRDSAGQPVSRVAAGSYDIQATDWSGIHNFDLLQSNVSLFSTDIPGTGESSATVSLAAGTANYRCDAHVSMHGNFTIVAALAADGSGAMAPSVSSVAPGSGKTVTFMYTASSGGTGGGAVTLAVPDGWSAPSKTGSAAGYVTASTGSLGVSGQTITVSGLNLNGGDTFTITYGNKSAGGPGATVSSGTDALWQAQERSTSDGTLTALSSSPQVSVVSQDGSGSMSPSTNVVTAGAGRTVTFTYTAASGGTSAGSVSLNVPNNWSAPSTTASAPGFVTASEGSVSVLNQTITVSGLTLNGGDTVTVTYGDTGQGGPGATATPSNGAQGWTAQEASTSGGTLTALSASPMISVVSSDGSGALTTPRTLVSASQTNNTILFTYTAAAGGTSGGTVKLVVPSGWSAPSTAPQNGGYSTSTAGTLSVSSRTILVSGLTLQAGSQMTITYGARTGGGAGAKAPAVVGNQVWPGAERSTASGTLTTLTSPHITVLAHDGSGTMGASPTSVVHSSQHQTVVFTYTAAAGGTSRGAVTLVVPTGWSAPSLSNTAPGCVRASRGSVSISGRTIVVGGLNLTQGTKFTIAYGVKTTAGGPGAVVPSSTGVQSWTTRERSWTGGVYKLLASSPSITIT